MPFKFRALGALLKSMGSDGSAGEETGVINWVGDAVDCSRNKPISCGYDQTAFGANSWESHCKIERGRTQDLKS